MMWCKVVRIAAFLSLSLLWMTASAVPNVSVAFILDESDSINNDDFTLQTEGFRSALKSLPADDSIEVSVVGFSSRVELLAERQPLTASGFTRIDEALSQNTKASQKTNLSGAISQTQAVLDQSGAASKILCLATDGQPNNESNARRAATSAKNAGIVLAPIGVGLSAQSRTFLDSIASEPPTPNPSDFQEFASVVRNVCASAVARSAGISLSPEPVNFGRFAPASLGSTDESRTAQLTNNGSTPVTINGIKLSGIDEGSFEITRVGQEQRSRINFPLTLSVGSSVPIEVAFKPIDRTPGQVGASLSVTGQTARGVSAGASIGVNAVIGTPSLEVDVLDGGGGGGFELITDITENSSAGYLSQGNPLTELRISNIPRDALSEIRRDGLVADGNTRLLLRVRTTVKQPIRFSLPGSTGTRLDNLRRTDAGLTELTIPASKVVSVGGTGKFQGTAVLVAGSRLRGSENTFRKDFPVNISVLANDDTPIVPASPGISVRRAPVVLIHGLWSSNDTWTHDPWFFGPDEGMAPALEGAYRPVGYFSYKNDEGPSETMTPDETGLRLQIAGLCLTLNDRGYACTRADIVAHSMGGLVARKYIADNNAYRRSLNYNQGNVRRLITLGTPHYGSPLGDVLDPNLSDDISCPSASGFISAPIVGVVDLWKGYDSAIRDLRPGSALLDKLNQGLGQEVPSFGVAGDVEGFALNVSSIKGQALYSLARILDCQGLISVASDGLVSVESASGNFSPSAVTVFDDIFHTQLPTSQRAVDEVLRVLRVPEGELSRYALRSRGKQSANSLPSYLVDRSRRPSVATRDPSFLGIAFDLFGVSAASAQEASGIRLSVDDPSPRPGGSVKFSAQVTGEATGPLILSDGGELTRIDDEPPYRWTLDLAPTASSERDFFVAGAVDDNAIRSNSVTVTVKPDLTQLREIGFEPARPINLFSGQTRALRLLGLFDDGLRRVLTQGAMETNYSERVVDGLQSSDGDSAVIEVSADGVLTAAEPGEAEVVATNNGNTTVKRVKVSPVAAEDADGDGLSNNDEADAGTDPFHMDTDRDGSSDNVEVGPDSGQPLSTGTDGRIDAMNPDVIAVQTENGIYVSVSSSAGTIQDVGSRTGEFLPQIPDDIATDPMALGIIEFEIADLMPGQNAEVTFTSSATIEPAGPYVGYGPVLPDGTEPKWFSANDVVESGYSGIVLRLSDNKVGDSNPRSGFIASTGAPSARQEKATGSGGGGGCTLAASASQRIDPILPCLALLSLLIVGFRRRNRGVGDVRS